MLTVVRVDVVGGFKTSTEADYRCLFAQIEVAIAAYAGFGIHFTDFFLKTANKNHLVIVVEECIAVFSLRERRRRMFLNRCRALRIRLLFTFRFQDVPDPFLSETPTGSRSGEALPYSQRAI